MHPKLLRAARLAKFFYLQRFKGFGPPVAPHFDEATTAWFRDRLPHCSAYLEFGSGGSTVLAGQLGIPTVSVEGDRFYAKAVRSALPASHKVTILTPDMGFTGEWGMPLRSSGEKGMKYLSAPFDHRGDKFPDLILIDGRYRVACALEIARQANLEETTSTLLFDDYINRFQYHAIEQFLGSPFMVGRSAIFDVGARIIDLAVVERYSVDPS